MLKRACRTVWLGVLSAVCVVPCRAHAQSRVIGQIQRIRSTSGKESCRPPGQSVTGSVRLLRGTSARPLAQVPPPEPLRLNDSVRVAGDFDARITIDDPSYGLGDIVLAPRLLCRVIGADLMRGIAADTGIYTLSARGDTLRFAVQAGGAYITWTDARKLCRLQVVVPGATASICGTTVIVAVDATGRRGLFYLTEGAARLGSVIAARGDVFRLGTGQTPLRLTPAQATTAIDQKNVDFHAKNVWKSFPGRVLRNPWTYVGLSAVGGGAVWVATHPKDASRVKATIVLRIPI